MQVIIEEPKVEVDLLEPILEENRMCVEYRHVSAYVPAKVTPGGFFSGLQLPAFTAKAKAKEKDKLRRVSIQLISPTDSPLVGTYDACLNYAVCWKSVDLLIC